MKKIALVALLLMSSAATAKEVAQERTDEWIALQTEISKLSREQNGGKVDYGKICYMIAEDIRACHFGIYAYFDGQNRMLIQTDVFHVSSGNENGEHIAMMGRAVCDRDHKLCKDFDSGETWAIPKMGK